ncbi:hypothetical protein DZE60_11130 [Salmonella enterica]|nr:hypothetical protein [Salmonella enterica]EBH8366202.1 hypothetical protein [Salmonella enterica subsp. enterica serovar Lexington]ECC3250082.1 hypothetical protein [Salmonella enterica subsp. enterica]EAM9073018.1 hypothetical protein [Salmonella enterica]EAN8497337.1 hypothetical protein [Salmonella enterica]
MVMDFVAHYFHLKKMLTELGELEAMVPSMALRVYSATSSQWRSAVKVTVVSIKGNCHRQ